MKKEIEAKLKLDTYKVLSEIVEAGIDKGWLKAKTVMPNPTDDTIREYVLSSIMIKLEEYIDFTK